MFYAKFINRNQSLPRMYHILGKHTSHACPHNMLDKHKNEFSHKFKFIDDYHFNRYCGSFKDYQRKHKLYQLYWTLHKRMDQLKKNGS
jgi:hypothetical protein